MTSETNEFVRQLLNQMQEEMTKEYFKQESTTSTERLRCWKRMQKCGSAPFITLRRRTSMFPATKPAPALTLSPSPNESRSVRSRFPRIEHEFLPSPADIPPGIFFSRFVAFIRVLRYH